MPFFLQPPPTNTTCTLYSFPLLPDLWGHALVKVKSSSGVSFGWVFLESASTPPRLHRLVARVLVGGRDWCALFARAGSKVGLERRVSGGAMCEIIVRSQGCC